ncbi:MAG: DUF86 domain-containing protein [Phycisphaerae bacterium]
MSRSAKERLLDILDAIAAIDGYVEGMKYADFLADRKTRDAVVRNIEVIGEAARSLPARFKEKYSDVPWTEIVGMRNVVVHHYFGILSDVVWNIVKQELPELESHVKKILVKTQ